MDVNMDGIEDQDVPRGMTSVLNWYDSTRPMFIDLVGDYAGKELFLVEGDSLLRECFEDDRIDFHGNSPSWTNNSLLTLQVLRGVVADYDEEDNTYVAVSKFYTQSGLLKDFSKTSLKDIASFISRSSKENHARICIPSGDLPAKHAARYLLARSVIKRHLALHLPSESAPSLEVHMFPSVDSDEFAEYLNEAPIHFAMVHDGEERAASKFTTEPELIEQDENLLPKIKDKDVKTLLRGTIWWFNTHKFNVALINQVEFRDSKVFTMIVENVRNTRFRVSMVKFNQQIQAAKDSLEKISSSGGLVLDNLLDAEDLENLEEAFSEEELSESYFLAVYGVSQILKQKECTKFMASAFIMHSILLKHLALSQRRFPLVTFDDDFEQLIDEFLAKVSNMFRHVVENEKWNDFMEEEQVETDAVDLIDGRLFRVVIQAMSEDSLHGAVPQVAKPDWEALSGLVALLSEEELSPKGSTETLISKSTAKEDDFEVSGDDLAVLPFSNSVFDKHLACIHVDTDTSLAARLGSMKIYRETTHWHNHRKPLNPKAAPVVKVSKWRNPLRTNQFYMKEMTSYAASLTGAKGKALEPETITVGPKILAKVVEEKPEKPEKHSPKPHKEDQKGGHHQKPNTKKGTKKGTGALSMKQQIIADNEKRKGSTESDKAFVAWTTIMKGLLVISDHQDRYLKTLAYLNGLDATKASFLEAEINTFILQSLLEWWVEYCKEKKKTEGYHVVALIWTTIRSICDSKAPITEEIVQHMTKICTRMEITDSMASFKPSPTDRKLSFTFKYPLPSLDISIGISQCEFQLNYCGPYMDRMLDAKPDPRVSSFVPDGWQRDVLDQIDANKSVFVVAPTSAGKTFISFYAMEQVLRAGNDGVLVYVAPTKALVNQIAAEIQGRFSKKFNVPGKGVWAIHTRDYRVNHPTGCQILVTVPHILQIMLLSPSNANSWAPRVRRIIFDEIHSIGQAEDGVVWEQLLLLAPCPIIALSATVGNPEEFNDWLMETQKALGSELKMIQHGTRYSDLRKYMYTPPKNFPFSGLGKSYGAGLGLDGLTGFEAFHPVASLVDKSRGMPNDLALEPRDCLSLWKCMCKFQTAEYTVPDSLNPEKALPPVIRKIDIFTWEKALKKLLLNWMADSNSPFDKVVADLTGTTSQKLKAIDETPSSTNSSVTEGETVDKYDLKATTLPLLYQLNQRRALPAILFNYDRAMCEEIGYSVLKQLVDAEAKWKEGPQWKKLMDGWEEYKKLKEKKSSRKPPKPSKKSKGGDEDGEGGSKLDRMREEASDGSSIYDLFDPEAPQTEFSFANPKQLQQAELDGYLKSLRWKHIREELIQLLQRGIGIHHAGMNRKYRQCVEMLFRKGFLRVVIATGTLSLGINMPCATVVFSGDSVYLTALNFRQASGRSGRRGFDLLGNVVFQNIPRERASRLLSSRLPELTGHFPITTTLVLRLFTLLNDSKNSTYAVKAINSLLSQPRLYLGGQSFKEQVLHHLRFSIEYLRRNELIGPAGEPVNFTSCVSHLYYTENSSFAFHALLKGGYFHKLCTDIDQNTDSVLRTMMVVLCHIFGRQICRVAEDPEEVELIKRSPSIVYLPPMPEDATKILRKHNKETLDIFTTYVKTFAAQNIKEEERYLPLTQVPVGLAPSSGNGKQTNGHATSNGNTEREDVPADIDFLPVLPAPDARSAFVALSGLGDKFTTIEDLCSSTREGVFLEAAVIPHLEIHPEESKAPLNAYLLDFFMHGSIAPLVVANGIRKSDVWFLLNDFSMVLATITTSLALHLGLAHEGDSEMLDVMGSGDAAENEADEEVAATTIAEPSTMKFHAPSIPPPPKKSKKVVDDWNAGEDALVAEEDYLKSEALKEMGVNEDEEYDKLLDVYKSFRKLKAEFDEKFRAIWA